MRFIWMTLLLVGGWGCCPADREVAMIGHYGGTFIPSGEAWAVNCPPLLINQIHDAGSEQITIGQTKMTPKGRKELKLNRPPSPP